MRNLQFMDAFALARIIEAANLNEKVKDIIQKYQGKQGETIANEAGIEIILDLICGISNEKAENEVYKLLGSIAEKNPNEIKTMSFDELYNFLKELSANNHLKDFLSRAGRLIQGN